MKRPALNCKRCGVLKTTETCGRYRSHGNVYYKTYCISCSRLRAKIYTFENKDKILQCRERIRLRDPDRWRELSRIRGQRRDLKDPDKKKTRAKTQRLIRDGKLIPCPCKYCGGIPSEAHHLDYRDHSKIDWLCTSHHHAWHRVFVAEEETK